jgi:hypothetical protein
MHIRPTEKPDVTAMAERALIAGEGIPAWLCAQRPGQYRKSRMSVRLYQRPGFTIAGTRPVDHE